jgi:hypothetical protein
MDINPFLRLVGANWAQNLDSLVVTSKFHGSCLLHKETAPCFHGDMINLAVIQSGYMLHRW